MSSANAVLSEKACVPETEKSAGGLGFYFKLILLYLLNISDWLCTMALISSGSFYEANPIMNRVFESVPLTLIIKGAVPLALSVLCAALYKAWGISETFAMKAILYVGIIIYSLLNLWHIVNFLLLFFSA